jgi:hypothetical protein
VVNMADWVTPPVLNSVSASRREGWDGRGM